jgi:hypothetical protein
MLNNLMSKDKIEKKINFKKMNKKSKLNELIFKTRDWIMRLRLPHKR